MSPRLLKTLVLFGAPWLLIPVFGQPAQADGGCAACGGGGCGVPLAGCTKCPLPICCPKFVHCTPKPPKICYKCICPKPVCDPCRLEGAGYYPTCWRPWVYPPRYGHCPAPGPALSSYGPPPIVSAEETLKSPRRLEPGPTLQP